MNQIKNVNEKNSSESFISKEDGKRYREVNGKFESCIRVAVSKRSERFDPSPAYGTVEWEFKNLEEAISRLNELLQEQYDFKVSIASDNSNIVGLGVDYDIEIQDVTFKDDGEE